MEKRSRQQLGRTDWLAAAPKALDKGDLGAVTFCPSLRLLV
jgi:hypothetical protein